VLRATMQLVSRPSSWTMHLVLCELPTCPSIHPQVPAAWLKTYPSLKPLGAWTRDLLARIEQLARWGADTYPKVYWLGGFTYPTGLLTAVLQVGTRAGGSLGAAAGGALLLTCWLAAPPGVPTQRTATCTADPFRQKPRNLQPANLLLALAAGLVGLILLQWSTLIPCHGSECGLPFLPWHRLPAVVRTSFVPP
jgi:hypothetical protein